MGSEMCIRDRIRPVDWGGCQRHGMGLGHVAARLCIANLSTGGCGEWVFAYTVCATYRQSLGWWHRASERRRCRGRPVAGQSFAAVWRGKSRKRAVAGLDFGRRASRPDVLPGARSAAWLGAAIGVRRPGAVGAFNPPTRFVDLVATHHRCGFCAPSHEIKKPAVWPQRVWGPLNFSR